MLECIFTFFYTELKSRVAIVEDVCFNYQAGSWSKVKEATNLARDGVANFVH